MSELCLDNQQAFIDHYQYDPKMKRIVESGIAGLTTGGAIAGGAATTAVGSGLFGISWLGGTTIAAAVSAVLPVAIPLAIGAGCLFWKKRKDKEKIKYSCTLNDLAKVVGDIIFLPMIAYINEKLRKNNDNIQNNQFAFNYASKKIKEWGYKQEFAEKIIKENTYLKSECRYTTIINEIDRLKNDNDLYNNSVPKFSIKPEYLKQMAIHLKNEVKRDCQL